MTTILEKSIDELKTLISFMYGKVHPDWLVHDSDFETQTMRAGVSKLLSWMRAMNMSKRYRKMNLTKQPWAEVVKSVALSCSYLELDDEQMVVVLSESLSDKDKSSLCEAASEYRPRLMK